MGEAIEDFGQEMVDWLRKFALFENGVLSYDRIFTILNRFHQE